jgi:hypothetical protein
MDLLPPDFDGDPPQTNQDLGVGTGTWAPAAQDTDFLDRAPDGCPCESMRRALQVFLRLGKEERMKRPMDTLKFLQEFADLSPGDLAPHVVMRIAVAEEDKPAEEWYATHFLSEEEIEKGFPRLRKRVFVEEAMDEDAEREASDHMSEGAAREEGGTGFHAGALGFMREDDETLAGANLESLRLSGAEGDLRGLRLGEGQDLPRRPQTARTHEEVRSRLSTERESLGRRGASGKEASLLAQVRENSAQEDSDREADDFVTHEGVETTGQVLGYFVRKWRRKADGDQTCADLDGLLSAHPPHAPTPTPAVESDPKMDVLKARSIFEGSARREFVFRKGVQTRGAPQNAPASEAALAWLAEKARTSPQRVVDGSNFYFPHTHEVFRRILAEIYNPTRLADLQGPAPANTTAMADLAGRFAFRTKGFAQDFEANVYHGAVIVSFRAQGQTVTIDLEKRITAEGRKRHHEFIDKVLKGETPLDKLTQQQQSLCFSKDAKRYALLHPAVPLQLRVYLEPRITEDGLKRYFQLEMDPEGEDVLPLTSVQAGEPYFHLNRETGALEGCFFSFLADFDDPHKNLRAETLNTFGHVDSVAACHQVDDHTPIPEGKTRAGLLCFMGAIPASAHEGPDIWQRRWVLLQDCPVVRFFYNPNQLYCPKELEHHEMFPGVHTTPGHCVTIVLGYV